MGEHRRAEDKLRDSIDAMISSESDPKQRAFLIVVSNINHSIVVHTETIQTINAQLKEHIRRYEEHAAAEERAWNQGRGAWKIASWVLGITQVVGVALWIEFRADMTRMHDESIADRIAHTEFYARLKVLEDEKVIK